MEKDNKINPAVGGTQSKVVETYAEDMAKVLEDDKSGIIKKIIHGEEEHEKEKRNLSPESKKNQFFMFMGALFILLGLFTLFYFLIKRDVSTVPVEKQFVPLIFNDKSNFLEIGGFKKDEIIQIVLKDIRDTEVKKGGVEGIYLANNKKVIGLREFLTLIKSNLVLDNQGVDGQLFVSDNFLMGVVNTEGKSASDVPTAGKDFFILLKVRSIADVFDSLRAWEDKIFLDLHGFFGVEITPENKYLLTANFEDGIVGNKNARILYEKNDAQTSIEELATDVEIPEDPVTEKRIAVMYILADDNSIVITNTESAAQEIMLRLVASRVKK